MNFKLPIVILSFFLVNGYAYSLESDTEVGCVKYTGNEKLDMSIATVIAKGNLAMSMGGKVTATQSLKSKSNSDDEYTDTISVKSEHFIPKIKVVETEVKTINNIKKYCVTVKVENYDE